jgi:hypothetical protein
MLLNTALHVTQGATFCGKRWVQYQLDIIRRQCMNKKLATLLFAIGLGATSAQALASYSCFTCHRQYQACIAAGEPEADCAEAQILCNDLCG